MKTNLKSNYKKIVYIALPIFVAFLILDLLTKYFTNKLIPVGEQRSFLPGFINLINVHNDGGAWNIFSGNQIFLIIFTSLFLVAFLYFYLHECKNGVLFHIGSALLITGCLGNLIDRIGFNYVRDMLHFQFFPTFPVFNVADICVCVGIAVLILFYIISLIKSSKKEKKQWKKKFL